MIPGLSDWSLVAGLANHLWQSTLCVGAAALLVRALRRHAARLRYRVWLLAALKFLLPFSLLLGLGRYLPAAHFASSPTPLVSVAVHVIGEPFAMDRGDESGRAASRDGGSEVAGPSSRGADPRVPRLMWLFAAVWAIGSTLLVVSRWVRWRRLANAAAAAPALHAGREAESLERARELLRCTQRIDLRSSSSLFEPGVIGAIRPILLWPAALTARLTDAELDAILVHELSHIRNRDNLAAAAHALLQTVFWFHPVMWWLEAKLVDERERACDEDVLCSGSEPQTYAGSILKVCDFCLQSPVAWVAGVTGSNLAARVEEIMTKDVTRVRPHGQRALLAIAALLLVVPVGLGALRGDPTLPAATPIADRATPSPTIEPIARIAAPQAATGGVTGVITDQSDGLLVGALVTIAGTQRGTVTDADGRYILRNLTPGQYALLVQLPGFKTSKTPLRIEPGIDVTQDVRLAIGSVAESLNVTGKGVPGTAPVGTPVEGDTLPAAQNTLDLVPAPPPAGGPLRVGGEIKEPKKIRDVKPVYPPDALAAGVQGMVIMEAVIATDGTVRDAQVLRSVPGLDQAALDAVRQWAFTPTTLNGVPVEVAMTVTVNFTLQ